MNSLSLFRDRPFVLGFPPPPLMSRVNLLSCPSVVTLLLLLLLLLVASSSSEDDEEKEMEEEESTLLLPLVRALARTANESALSKFLTEPELGTSWWVIPDGTFELTSVTNAYEKRNGGMHQ